MCQLILWVREYERGKSRRERTEDDGEVRRKKNDEMDEFEREADLWDHQAVVVEDGRSGRVVQRDWLAAVVVREQVDERLRAVDDLARPDGVDDALHRGRVDEARSIADDGELRRRRRRQGTL